MASVREIDKNDDIYVGVRFPLDHSQEGFFYKTKTILEQAKSNMRNLLLTSSADHSLTFDKAGEEKFTFSHAGSGLFIQNDGTNQLAFIQDHDIRIYNSSGNETATFRDSGRVGIGTTSPSPNRSGIGNA